VLQKGKNGLDGHRVVTSSVDNFVKKWHILSNLTRKNRFWRNLSKIIVGSFFSPLGVQRNLALHHGMHDRSHQAKQQALQVCHHHPASCLHHARAHTVCGQHTSQKIALLFSLTHEHQSGACSDFRNSIPEIFFLVWIF